MAFRVAAKLDELWSGEMLGVCVEGTRVLLVNIDGTVHAYEDRCAHQRVPLSEGRLEGHLLTCAAHGWQYDARTGQGVNPRGVAIPRFPLCIEGGCGRRSEAFDDQTVVLVDVEPQSVEVGPVLEAGAVAEAVIAAIREGDDRIIVLDRGAYLRVKAPLRCAFTRAAVERHLGAAFRLPGDLERIMPSFKGTFAVTDEDARWTAEDAP